MSATPENLAARCRGLRDGAGAAVEWVAEVRDSSRRLDRDADGLVERLRRARNVARRLGAAAERPMAVGFFGLSQAGKSYLIS
ncbi:MAG: virulence factor SrfC family protein, partial [Rhodospirillaceae bacterium]|nr:virulence factor SrfC family protein [Rhodospirillaceae bacterium]